MISLSLGLNSKDNDIEREIDEAVGKGISIFAAASNEGGNRSRTYPANKSDLSVLCIHASDGMGNDGRINPTPVPGEDNFSTLGIGISSRWKGKEKHISGTSFATPIAAGLVANVLEFARIKCHLDEHQQRSLHRSWGVRKVLRLMVGRAAGKRGGYDYVVPASLATEYGWEEKLKEEILRIVRDL
ncbi:peptidase S8/S53 domain-containing protein [Nemania sp. FL0031]|nr:peptidase S8/S53 domain-containing protein [Nemania sp. FL0031]